MRGALHLGQLVGDEDDAAAGGGDALAHREQRVDLGGQQHGGRLVEHEQLRVAEQALDDLDALALADRQVGDARVRRHLEAVLGPQRLEPARAFGALEHAVRLAEQQVVDDARIADQAEVLMHHRDALRERVARAGGAVRAAGERHAAGVGRVDAEDDVAQRRLAGAVLAEQAVDLAGTDVERDAVERGQRAEALADAVERDSSAAGGRRKQALRCIVPDRLDDHPAQPSSVLILPSLMAFSASSSLALTSGVALQTTIADACGPIASPNAL